MRLGEDGRAVARPGEEAMDGRPAPVLDDEAGIEESCRNSDGVALIEPDAPISGNAYDVPADGPGALPQTLWDAAQRLKASAAARDLFGDEFVDHFASTREWEEREFRKHISDWELARYFEAI